MEIITISFHHNIHTRYAIYYIFIEFDISTHFSAFDSFLWGPLSRSQRRAASVASERLSFRCYYADMRIKKSPTTGENYAIHFSRFLEGVYCAFLLMSYKLRAGLPPSLEMMQ